MGGQQTLGGGGIRGSETTLASEETRQVRVVETAPPSAWRREGSSTPTTANALRGDARGTNGQRDHHEVSSLLVRLPPQLDRDARLAFIWKMVSGNFET